MLHTFIETKTFKKMAKNFGLDLKRIHSIQIEILSRPRGDAHLCQTLYKIRIATETKGKRGGLRVWFFYFNEHVYLLFVLPKSEGENIDKNVQDAMCRKIARLLKGDSDEF